MNHPDNTITFGSEAQDRRLGAGALVWVPMQLAGADLQPRTEFGILSPGASGHPAG